MNKIILNTIKEIFIMLLILSSLNLKADNVSNVLRDTTKNKGTIIVSGSSSSPPFQFLDDKGSPSGFGVELMDTILSRLNLKHTFKLKKWNKAYNEFINKESDILLNYVPVSANDNNFLLSYTEYYTDYSLLVLKSSPINSFKDMDGKCIFVSKLASPTSKNFNSKLDYYEENELLNDYSLENFWKIFRLYKSNPSSITWAKPEYSLKQLLAKKCDVIVGYKQQFSYYLNNKEFGFDIKDFKLIDLHLNSVPNVYACYDKDLLADINTQLFIAISDGTMESIKKRWFPLSKIQSQNKDIIVIQIAIGLICLIIVVIAVVLYFSLRREKVSLFIQKKYLNMILDVLPFPVNIYDVKNNFDLYYQNDSSKEIFGDNLFSFFNKNSKEYYYNNDHKIDKIVVETGEKFNDQILIMKKDGSLFNAIIRKSIIKKGKDSYIITEVNDIDDLVKEREKAEKSDKLKSNFLANMSHDIRTPLNAILGFSELLKDSNDTEEMREYARAIYFSNEQMLRLISEILDITQWETGTMHMHFETFDIVSYIAELRNQFDHLFHEKDVKFIIDCPYNKFYLHTDKMKLTQLISNFITNANKFTNEGYIRLGILYVDKYLVIYVKDTGMGISKENQQKVFKRYMKLNDIKSGTGLGMAICQAIVEKNGGKIGLNSEEGKGSLFWVVSEISVSNIECKKDNEYDKLAINEILSKIDVVNLKL